MKNQNNETTNEIWIDVLNFEGLYQVSDLGNIKSLRTGKIMKQSIHGKGYFIVGLHKDKKHYNGWVHNLVYTSFNGSIPDNYMIDHIIPHSQLDNRLINLQLVTNRVNSLKDVNKNETSSKYRGVTKKFNKWVAYIMPDKCKKIHLGTFNNEDEAYLCRLQAEKKYNIQY